MSGAAQTSTRQDARSALYQSGHLGLGPGLDARKNICRIIDYDTDIKAIDRHKVLQIRSSAGKLRRPRAAVECAMTWPRSSVSSISKPLLAEIRWTLPSDVVTSISPLTEMKTIRWGAGWTSGPFQLEDAPIQISKPIPDMTAPSVRAPSAERQSPPSARPRMPRSSIRHRGTSSAAHRWPAPCGRRLGSSVGDFLHQQAVAHRGPGA